MVAELQQKMQHLLTENASTILSAAGVVGTVGTAILTGRAGFKAAQLIQEENSRRETYEGNSVIFDDVERKEAVLLTWPLFIAPVGMGTATIASIVLANRISVRKAAALAAAYGLSERSFQEYKEKALEKLGVNKEQKLRDEIAQDQVSKDTNHQVIMVGDGDVLFYDQLTGRYFKSTVEKVKKAEAEMCGEIYKHMSVSFSQFCHEIGLDPTEYTEMVGWNMEQIPEVEFSTTITSDDRPCMVMYFTYPPVLNYAQIHS